MIPIARRRHIGRAKSNTHKLLIWETRNRQPRRDFADNGNRRRIQPTPRSRGRVPAIRGMLRIAALWSWYMKSLSDNPKAIAADYLLLGGVQGSIIKAIRLTSPSRTCLRKSKVHTPSTTSRYE
jgi:hypothetical protein